MKRGIRIPNTKYKRECNTPNQLQGMMGLDNFAVRNWLNPRLHKLLFSVRRIFLVRNESFDSWTHQFIAQRVPHHPFFPRNVNEDKTGQEAIKIHPRGTEWVPTEAKNQGAHPIPRWRQITNLQGDRRKDNAAAPPPLIHRHLIGLWLQEPPLARPLTSFHPSLPYLSSLSLSSSTRFLNAASFSASSLFILVSRSQFVWAFCRTGGRLRHSDEDIGGP